LLVVIRQPDNIMSKGILFMLTPYSKVVCARKVEK